VISIGLVGAGQFARELALLFRLHPGVGDVYVTDLQPERAEELTERDSLSGVIDSFETLLRSDVDAVAIFTQRWTHGPLVTSALRAGKHVFCAVPMAVPSAK
jgi:predicted dehydrogenase